MLHISGFGSTTITQGTGEDCSVAAARPCLWGKIGAAEGAGLQACRLARFSCQRACMA